ncbi:low molecular weight phosphatase family protein [Corynebacterium tuberculostearicum]|uniref:arsenate reductase/protein-tyrosine-phosphatase family protein n=1 Tax=Corynebacterium TaxID=1716 RepID=UPI001EF378D2|nr:MULTISPECIES: low molecular weight phosphatase family protein [Corynebacterium]MCG7465421.1 low molecular weight phosphatase family protein [Corynebacterium sp. ACRPJ]WKE53749.1 low molecular weight phosphatase family protein [Corynebacterium tuberculostearicum]
MTSVLFLCNTNRGKSQMAAALAAKYAPEWEIYSAGVQTTPEHTQQGINQEAKASLAKVGAEMTGTPALVDPHVAAAVDHVIVVGDATYEGPAQRWDIEDPSLRGLEGEERMDALRDDIEARVVEFLRAQR